MEREQLNYYLQQVSQDELDALCRSIEKVATVELIQKPTAQTLLVPVHDPINQGSFISGEVLVSSAIVQVNAINGWAMVMDQDDRRAVSVALLDAAFTADIKKAEIHQLATHGKERVEENHTNQNARINATRVSFDLL